MKVQLLTLACICATAVWAQDSTRPRGLEQGSLAGLPASSIAPDASPELQFSVAPDGTRVYLAKYQLQNAAGLRIHLKNFHLTSTARVFLYAPDGSSVAGPFRASGPVTGSDDFWAPAIAGDSVIVEYQVSGDAPANLPFAVAEAKSLTAEELQAFQTPATASGEFASEPRTSIYDGQAITHTVAEGMAIAEGDIMLAPAADLPAATDQSRLERRAYGVGAKYSLWPNGIVPYTIDGSMPDQGRVQAAIAHWNSKLNGVIKLVPRSNEVGFVAFSRSASSGLCSSFIGRLGIMQTTYLGDSCTMGNVIHEIGHVLGLYHEHTRPDRDSYIRVNWANIDPSSAYNFSLILGGKATSSYDYNSIMHYPAYGFSDNGLPAIDTIPAGIPIGQRDGLSSGDIAGIQALYGGTVIAVTPPTTVSTTPAPAPSPAPAPAPTPSTGTVALSTNPAGLQLNFDGGTVNTPFTSGAANAGTNHTISAPSVLTGNSTRYTFGSWSNGAGQSFNFSQTAGQTAFTASYATQYQLSANAGYGGSVQVSPASGDGYYPANSNVTITATPQPGFCFTGWSGLLAGSGPSANLTVSGPGAVSATFGSGAVSLSSVLNIQTRNGGNVSVGVTSSGGCGWSASTNVNWISFPNGSSGSGSNTLNLAVAQNTSGSLRTGFVTVGNTTFIVYQFPF